MSREVENQLSE